MPPISSGDHLLRKLLWMLSDDQVRLLYRVMRLEIEPGTVQQCFQERLGK